MDKSKEIQSKMEVAAETKQQLIEGEENKNRDSSCRSFITSHLKLGPARVYHPGRLQSLCPNIPLKPLL